MSIRCRQRKCCNCHQLYDPDPRGRYHQKHCPRPECRKASKAASQRRWRESDKGRDYFRGSANALRVKAWRAAHPGYARGRPGRPPKPSCALQEDCQPQSTVLPEVKPTLGESALQEMIVTQSLILTGLIVQLTGEALQDDIGQTLHRLIRLGQQVKGLSALPPAAGGQPYGSLQTSALQGAVAASAPQLELDRPSPGP
jgi:hypothetical protein